MQRTIIFVTGILSYCAPIFVAVEIFYILPSVMFSTRETDSVFIQIFGVPIGLTLFACFMAFSVMIGSVAHDAKISIFNRIGLITLLLVFNVLAMPFFWHFHFKKRFTVE